MAFFWLWPLGGAATLTARGQVQLVYSVQLTVPAEAEADSDHSINTPENYWNLEYIMSENYFLFCFFFIITLLNLYYNLQKGNAVFLWLCNV